MDPGTDSVRGLSVSSRPERGYVIAALSGERGIARAAALREKFPGLLRRAASRLVTGLSGVSYADASGLAVLTGTGRRAGLRGGFLRLAAPAAAVERVLRITGLRRQPDVFPAVQAAITRPGRGQRWLPGHCGAPAAGLTALSGALLRVSRLAGDLGSRCDLAKQQWL
jgi:anti-sigma B factor antagonist